MAWRCTGATNAQLIDNLIAAKLITSQRVADAMRAVDRAHFCPRAETAYVDAPQPIGHNVTISAPHMHAMCLELLGDVLRPGANALDVGSGSGYLVAAMARLVGPQGRVVGVEHIPQLVAQSQANLRADDDDADSGDTKQALYRTVCAVHVTDGRLGWPDSGPYDAIHVGAAAEHVPQALKEQLKVGGKLVIPVGAQGHGQDLQLITRTGPHAWQTTSVCGVVYVPLTDSHKQVPGLKLTTPAPASAAAAAAAAPKPAAAGAAGAAAAGVGAGTGTGTGSGAHVQPKQQPAPTTGGAAGAAKK